MSGPQAVPARAVVFIDGNNWYHSLRDVGLADVGRLDYGAVSRKPIGPRRWVGTRYYIGQVRQTGNGTLYAGCTRRRRHRAPGLRPR